MSVQTLSRVGMALVAATLVSGCSLIGAGGPDERAERGDYSVVDRSDACRWNRGSCLYEGSYESGERAYAEQEARRLNQASVNRLRRAAR